MKIRYIYLVGERCKTAIDGINTVNTRTGLNGRTYLRIHGNCNFILQIADRIVEVNGWSLMNMPNER